MDEILEELWNVRNSKDALFLKLINNYRIANFSFKLSTKCFIKDEELIMEYDFNYKYMYIVYKKISSHFKTKYDISDEQIKEILIILIEKHLGLVVKEIFYL